jgi:imidazolonepropionase-like amidohydrolase
MWFEANRRAGTFTRVAALLVLAACFSPCSLPGQEQERETPPPPPLPPPQTRTHERLAIRAGRMFDGKSEQLAKQQIILIEGARITQVGSANDVHIPPGTDVLDLTNATVLPGLIDGHTHIFSGGPDLDAQMLKEPLQYRILEAMVNAQRDLWIGFTTLRDLKTLGGMYGDVDLRNAINNGLVQGPRLQVSGRGFATTGGFHPKGYSRDIALPSMLETVDSPWEARKGVREQLMNGTDWVKFYAAYEFSFSPDGKIINPPTFTLEEVQAFVDEAHAKGHKVSCHAFAGPGLHNCLLAGVDTVEHGVQLSDEDIQPFKTKGDLSRSHSVSLPAGSATRCQEIRRAHGGGSLGAELPACGCRRPQDWLWDRSWALSAWDANERVRIHGEVRNESRAGYSCGHPGGRADHGMGG